jgi:tRNA(Arg) A34 adenosine deaminase TadA
MAKAKLLFTERNVSRAVRAVARTGVPVGRVIVDPQGNIIVEVGDPTPTTPRKKADQRRPVCLPGS